MANRHSDSRVRKRTSSRDKGGPNLVYGVPVPEALHEAIENERDNLSKADSVLGCLGVSLQYNPDPGSGLYYPDVVQLARELLRQSINGLDSLVLHKRLTSDKIEEAAVPCFYVGVVSRTCRLH